MNPRIFILTALFLTCCLLADASAAKVDPANKRAPALVTAFTDLNLRLHGAVVGIERRIDGKRVGYGVLVSPEGEILTAMAAVSKTGSYRARLFDGNSSDLTPVAWDFRNDLVLLKMDNSPTGLTPLPAGNASAVDVGRFVISLSPDTEPICAGIKSCPIRRTSKSEGRPLLGLYSILTEENEGAKRPFPKILQHDSPVTARNLGGPVVTVDGKCVGLNVCAPWRGVSYAVPWEEIEKVLPVLRKGQDVTADGYVGIQIDAAKEEILEGSGIEGRGVLITNVIADQPAAAAGLKAGDIVTHINGERVETVEDLAAILQFLTPGDETVLKALRVKGGKTAPGEKDEEFIEIKIKVGTRPKKA
jgi:S1-C subfamily serine protease